MSNRHIQVLLIEDEAPDAHLLRNELSLDTNLFEVTWVKSLQAGKERLSQGNIDVILLDLGLPESHGLQTLTTIRDQIREVPVIVLTVSDDEETALEAVRHGAQDFLVKGKMGGPLISRVMQYAIERHRTFVALESLTLIDELTGLYNRRGFRGLALQHLKLAQRGKRGLVMLYADVDRLKHINDAFGHQAGDQALVETAEVLRNTFRTTDVIARVGGDEFAIVALEAPQSSTDLLEARLQMKLAECNAKPGRPYKLSLSTGTAFFDPKTGVTLDEMMATADKALYTRKRRGHPPEQPSPDQ